MGSHLKLCALAIVCTLAFGCAKKNSADETMRSEHFRHNYEAAFNKNQDQTSRKLLSRAKSAIGTPYVRGGTTPAGFDCSGFVSWAYKA
jgi:cell wall-associated NlpC family hydrolase